MKHSIIKIILFSALFSLAFLSCQTVEPVAEDLTAKQLIQKGQDSYNVGNYPQALRYYNAVLERFGDNDLPLYIEAKYEIGHIYMKQKHYSYAKAVFEEILDIYSQTIPGQIPAAYKKLSEIELEKIPG
ncbi:MAG: tetratricopeptide repeat protein [Treponema sp.]|nr:tetratricopeptide repeat protein [Treponema sp.]